MEEELDTIVQASQIFLFILTTQSSSDPHCRYAVRQAIKDGRQVIPLHEDVSEEELPQEVLSFEPVDARRSVVKAV